MNDETQIFINSTHDRERDCLNKCMLTSTKFLDLHQQSVVLKEHYDCEHILFGGYDDAERKMLVFLPDYPVDIKDFGVSCLKVSANGKKPLTHRDYLGALMSLGIKRENIGDIIVSEGGAQIIFRSELEEFLLTNLFKAGHTPLSCEVLPITDLRLSEANFKDVSKTIASERIDCVISAIFNMSRTLSLETIKSGLVFINGLEITKPTVEVKVGDRVTVRRKGKAEIQEIGKLTKKGRIILCAKIYS